MPGRRPWPDQKSLTSRIGSDMPVTDDQVRLRRRLICGAVRMDDSRTARYRFGALGFRRSVADDGRWLDDVQSVRSWRRDKFRYGRTRSVQICKYSIHQITAQQLTATNRLPAATAASVILDSWSWRWRRRRDDLTGQSDETRRDETQTRWRWQTRRSLDLNK